VLRRNEMLPNEGVGRGGHKFEEEDPPSPITAKMIASQDDTGCSDVQSMLISDETMILDVKGLS
jgi:hypothetical protein